MAHSLDDAVEGLHGTLNADDAVEVPRPSPSALSFKCEEDAWPEALHSSASSHPGAFFSGSGTAAITSTPPWQTLMTAQHDEVMKVLLRQEVLLQVVASKSSKPGFPLGSAEWIGRVMSNETRTEPPSARTSSSKEASSDGEDGSSMPSSSSLYPHKASSPSPYMDTEELPKKEKPKFFQSFSGFDMGLRQAAAKADSTRHRRKFASIKLAGNESESSKTSVHRYRRRLAELVSSNVFDIFFGIVVLVNAVFIGFETREAIADPNNPSTVVLVSHFVFLVLFTTELLMRLCAFGLSIYCDGDACWCILDTFIVITSLFQLVDNVIFLAGAEPEDNGAGPVQIIKAFRLLRVARIAKAVRLMKIFRFVTALRTLVTSIFHTLKSLFWALMLLFLIVYVFGILFSLAVNDHVNAGGDLVWNGQDLEANRKYFLTLEDTMLSLFMSISGGVSWEDVLAPLKAISTWWVICYVLFISFTYFAVLNVVTGVFCQSAIDSAQQDHASVVQAILEDKEAHVAKIRSLFNQFGGDGDTSVVTYAMFEEKINCPEVREYFESLGLDIWDAWSFFKLLDLDAGGEVEIDEFLMGCLRLRGAARAIDVGKIIHDQTWLIRSQSRFQSHVETQLARLTDMIGFAVGVVPALEDVDRSSSLGGVKYASTPKRATS